MVGNGAGGPCSHCHTRISPCWRKGPPSNPVLCNACGARYLVRNSLEGYLPGQKPLRNPSKVPSNRKRKTDRVSCSSAVSQQPLYEHNRAPTVHWLLPRATEHFGVDIETTATIYSDRPLEQATTITLGHADGAGIPTGAQAFAAHLAHIDKQGAFTVTAKQTHILTFPGAAQFKLEMGEEAWNDLAAKTLELLRSTPNATLSRGSIPVVRRRRKGEAPAPAW